MNEQLTPGLEIGLQDGEPTLSQRVVFNRRGQRMSEALRDVAADPQNTPEGVIQYWTMVEVSDVDDQSVRDGEMAYSLTYIPQRPMGWEAAKTHGHIHTPGLLGVPDPEVYEVLSGEGLFLMQDLREGPRSSLAIAVRAGKGDTVVLPPWLYHVSINVGRDTLVFGDVCSRHVADDYGFVKTSKGFSYYFTPEGEPRANPHYQETPELKILSAAEWSPQDIGPLYQTLRDKPEELAWLIDPDAFASRYPQFDAYRLP